ncbi:hypothetical protein Rfer_4455 (plasmid) [Rhodoferax ferrireducens T118]|uniref:Uncharacterized protein n=1 Tax=Albidiferax ferrireducens (strain ATCC BAA-621 / DSM 15236 / T118) TaxID=338969 RepID=Q21Q04_ALBFT|nr:hypothetical protein [Rhodoferax ferrireducens]ABD72141.1 hypothetical protein Rfer_4455 [Rhodoferax ferrireducens T118]
MTNQLGIVARLASALQKLMTGASPQLGADCLLHAQMAQTLLDQEGVPTRLVLGEAAWRVGPGDGDVITHSPNVGGFAPQGAKALAYHAWLESGTKIIDFSTHSLRTKAAQLDAFDGGKTAVEWCPPYLVLERAQSLTLKEVAQADSAGVACYQEIPGLREFMIEQCLVKEVDAGNLQLLRLVFDQPEIKVFGPNNRHDCDELVEQALKSKQSHGGGGTWIC